MIVTNAKILFTVHQFFPEFYAGTEVLTLNTAKELQRRGYQVGILSLNHTDSPQDFRNGGLHRSDYDGIQVWKLDFDFYKTPDPLTNEFSNPYMVEFMNEFIMAFKPDIVHIMHTFRFSASVIDVYAKYNLPIVMTATDFWFMCSKVQLIDSSNRNCTGPIYHGAKCIRCIAKQKGSRASSVLDIMPLGLIKIGVLLSKWKRKQSDNIKAVQFLSQRPSYLMNQLNKIDCVIVPTEIMKKMLIKNGANKDRIVKLHFGMNDVLSPDKVEVKKYSGKITFGYIGTILEHKGLHVLLEAFTRLDSDNAELLVYGDLKTNPSYTSRVKEIAKDDKRIKFMGTFPNSQIREVFSNIDILVVPSIWYENTPLVIFSAFESKVPVIATDLGGLTEVVKHGVNGMVFPKGNHRKLLEILNCFIDDSSLMEKLSSGIEPVKTISQNVDELESIYKRIVKE